ncbi:MAG: adenylate/guanylate cyclase domain-containing protein [Gemmatimonadetes bacterium]|nr:adenylate/guanylate cyclase domain-containing protein [Gemmatimonadota bacterium]
MKIRRLLAGFGITGSAALVAFGLTTVQFFEPLFGQLEFKTLDFRVRSAAKPPREKSDVVLVLFDSTATRDWPYLEPFPRAVLADLVDAVAGLGARAIGLDVYLHRPYPELDRLEPFVDGDARLRAAMARAGNVVLVAPSEGSGAERVLLPPHPYFAEVAAAVADAGTPTPFETQRDGLLTTRTEQGLVPSFALALYAQARGIDLDAYLAQAARSGTLPVPGLPQRYARIPEEKASQTAPILFVGPPSRPGRDDGAFLVFSSAIVQQVGALGDFMPDWFKNAFRDKIVLMGSGYHYNEQFRTPFYDETAANGEIFGWTYGVEVHANLLENLLTGRHPIELGTSRTLLLLLLLSLLVTAATFFRGVAWGAALALLLLDAVLWLAWSRFADAYVHLPIIGPTLALVFAFLGSTSYVSVVEGKEKRVIRGAFSKYVSPAVVDQLVADPSRLKLGGEMRTISILFSDLAGFTSMTEALKDTPEKLLSLLNEYLDEMADIVLEEGGTLDKYIGDAIMALYGAPSALPDHALRACRTAIRMQRRLHQLNLQWRDAGIRELSMRIGMNTGTPVVGNIGGQKRFDYTALGDDVNLAARLEPACKTYEVDILIAENTRHAAGAAVQVRELDLLAVYGKAQPVRVFELLGLAGDDIGPKAEVLAQYERGLETFRDRDFELATQYFQAALELDHTDGPSSLYLERCRECILNPPPADWDFVQRRQFK